MLAVLIYLLKNLTGQQKQIKSKNIGQKNIPLKTPFIKIKKTLAKKNIPLRTPFRGRVGHSFGNEMMRTNLQEICPETVLCQASNAKRQAGGDIPLGTLRM